MIQLALTMKAENISAEARKHHSDCGAGALAATVAAAKAIKAMGAEKGYLLQYTTSDDVLPEGCICNGGRVCRNSLLIPFPNQVLPLLASAAASSTYV